jgi:GAF domain-containing protein
MTANRADRGLLLAEAFVGLADTLVADYDVIEFMQRLSLHCVELLAVDAAGLMLSDQRGALHVVSSSTEHAEMVELFQLEADEGPCLDCFHTSRPVIAADLRDEGAHWPRFSQRAQAEGFLSVYAVPLRLREQTIGALNMFGAQAGVLTAEDIRLSQALADVATIGILQERALRRHEVLIEQLQSALNSRVVIEQAKGVVAERGGLDMEQAFAVLRRYARTTQQRLSDLARNVVDGTAGTDEMLEARTDESR